MQKYTFKPIVTLPIQFFAGEEFDVEAADTLIEQELQEESEEIFEPEGEIDPLDADVDPDVDPEVEEEEEVEELEVDLSTDDGRDTAFANLRRERDELAGDAEFIRQFAAANGMTVEELRKQHAQAQLEKQAEKEGVPVEVLQRLNAVEQENAQVKEQVQSERFNAQVTSTLAKYNGTEADFKATIQYAAQNGMLDAVKSGAVTFEAAYKLANMDTLIETAKKSAVQEDLATRKKRQQEAPISAGSQTQAAVPDELDAQVEADVKEIMEMMNF